MGKYIRISDPAKERKAGSFFVSGRFAGYIYTIDASNPDRYSYMTLRGTLEESASKHDVEYETGSVRDATFNGFYQFDDIYDAYNFAKTGKLPEA